MLRRDLVLDHGEAEDEEDAPGLHLHGACVWFFADDHVQLNCDFQTSQNGHYREALKNGLFGTLNQNGGGWGRVNPNFYKSLFLWHI